jgi:hypothetical protein
VQQSLNRGDTLTLKVQVFAAFWTREIVVYGNKSTKLLIDRIA